MAPALRLRNGSFSAGFGETGMEGDPRALAQLPEFRHTLPLLGHRSTPPRSRGADIEVVTESRIWFRSRRKWGGTSAS